MDKYQDLALMTPEDVAAYLQKPQKTLANWRSLGVGPTSIRVGRDVRYRKADVDIWLDDRTDWRLPTTAGADK